MNPDCKSLSLGIIVGVMVSLLVFVGGILVWERLVCAELKVVPNQLTSITIEGMKLDFAYDQNSSFITRTGGLSGSDRMKV